MAKQEKDPLMPIHNMAMQKAENMLIKDVTELRSWMQTHPLLAGILDNAKIKVNDKEDLKQAEDKLLYCIGLRNSNSSTNFREFISYYRNKYLNTATEELIMNFEAFNKTMR